MRNTYLNRNFVFFMELPEKVKTTMVMIQKKKIEQIHDQYNESDCVLNVQNFKRRNE